MIKLLFCFSFCFLTSCAGVQKYLQNNQVSRTPVIELPLGKDFQQKYKILSEWKTFIVALDEKDFPLEKDRLKYKLQCGKEGYIRPDQNGIEEDAIILQEIDAYNNFSQHYNVMYIKWLEPEANK